MATVHDSWIYERPPVHGIFAWPPQAWWRQNSLLPWLYLPTVTGKVLPHSRDGRCPLALLQQHHFASLYLEGSSRLLSPHHGQNLLHLHVLRWATLHSAKDQCCASIDLPLGTTALLLAIRTCLGTGRLHSRHSSVKISLWNLEHFHSHVHKSQNIHSAPAVC